MNTYTHIQPIFNNNEKIIKRLNNNNDTQHIFKPKYV